MSRSTMLVVAEPSCLAIAIAGFAKTMSGELPLGLTLIGFLLSLFGNFRCAALHLSGGGAAA